MCLKDESEWNNGKWEWELQLQAAHVKVKGSGICLMFHVSCLIIYQLSYHISHSWLTPAAMPCSCSCSFLQFPLFRFMNELKIRTYNLSYALYI